MKKYAAEVDCQIACFSSLSEEKAEMPPQSFGRLLRLLIRKRLGPKKVRATKVFLNQLLDSCIRLTGRNKEKQELSIENLKRPLKAGDLVRVRSVPEIESTLDRWKELKGCGFMPEVVPYCGTTHRVLKPIERFVDERTLKTHKAKGIVILEGLTCQGTSELGRCDRNCYYFWREEWLEKIEEKSG